MSSRRRSRESSFTSGLKSTVSCILFITRCIAEQVRAGDVIHLNILGKHFIVLNSRKAAVDLLDKRGSKYSDRPDFSALGL